MRLLRVNDKYLDLDDITAIGITFQAYDIADPGKRKVKYSNTFTIPATAKNRAIFGYPGNPHSIDTIVYNSLVCDYWDDNLHIIKNGRIRVDEVSDRISVFVYEVKDVFEQIKLLSYRDFLTEFFAWLTIPKDTSPFLGSYKNFLTPYLTATEGVYLPLFYSNLYGFLDNNAYIENTNSIYLNHNGASGSHFCVYYKTIFKWIEYKYGVNFLTSGGVKPGNIWDDPIAPKMYHPVRSLDVAFNYSGQNVTGFYFTMQNKPVFSPHADVEDMGSKSLFDVVNVFFQHFNILIDPITDGVNEYLRMARWDDIQSAEVVDWSGNITGQPRFKPSIDGYAQENKIKFTSIYPDGNEDVNSRVLTSFNRNIEAKIDLFEIDSYIPSSILVNSDAVLNLSTSESFETSCFLIDSGAKKSVNIFIFNGLSAAGDVFELNIAAVYSLSGEYQFLDSVIKYPKWYEVTKYLTKTDVLNLEFFKQYWIQELGGSFFINKIAGFNPSKGTQAVKIELFKISDASAVPNIGLDFWADGVGDIFTDGTGDYYF
jgi:hypothetical protein